MSDATWKRPHPVRTAPRRGAGGFYRAADIPGKAQGIPLSSTNDALVAAVRLAYRVAEAQVDRSSRLAARLRDAGDRVTGGDSSRKTTDATERLVMKSMMSALEWWETSVAQGRCPVKRLAAAEYQMIGQMLGLDPAKRRSTPSSETEDPPVASSRSARSRKRKLRIVLRGEQRRAVRVVDWQLDGGPLEANLQFFHDEGAALAGKLELDRGAATLTLAFPKAAGKSLPRGRWAAAICSPDDEQVGFIELSL